MNLLVKFPTRSRPDKFLEVLGKYTSMSTTGKVRYLITLDVEDELTNTQEEIRSMGLGLSVIEVFYVTQQKKEWKTFLIKK